MEGVGGVLSHVPPSLMCILQTAQVLMQHPFLHQNCAKTLPPPPSPPLPSQVSFPRSMQVFTPERRRYERGRKALFFSDINARRLYMDHMRAVLERRNAFTGRIYKARHIFAGK
jgi:hypothetical protein